MPRIRMTLEIKKFLAAIVGETASIKSIDLVTVNMSEKPSFKSARVKVQVIKILCKSDAMLTDSPSTVSDWR